MSNTPSSMVSTHDLPAEAWRAFAVGLLRRAEKTEPGFASVLAEEFRRVAMKWDFFEHMLPTVEGDRVSTEVLRDHTGKALAVRKIAKDRHGEIRDIVEFETDSEGRPVWLMPWANKLENAIPTYKVGRGKAKPDLLIPRRRLPVAHKRIVALITSLRRSIKKGDFDSAASLLSREASRVLNYLGISDREMRTRIGTNPRAVWAFMLQAAVFPGLGLLPPTEGTLKAMIDTCVSVDPPAQVSLGLLELICGVTAEHLRQEISHMRKEQTPEEQMGVWESIICR